MKSGQAWADVEEDDCPLPQVGDKEKDRQFISGPDAQGIWTHTEYSEKDGVSIKITKKVKKKTIKKNVNRRVVERDRQFVFFGDAMKVKTPPSLDDEFPMELNQALKHKSIGDDEKFWEESIGISEALMALGQKKKWDATAIRMGKIDEENAQRADNAASAAAAAAASAKAPEGKGGSAYAPLREGGAATEGRYVPPSMRNASRMEADKSKDETTLRVTNLSEDVRDGDLQTLFLPFGRLSRVFLAKYRDGDKIGQSKGFAFVTFNERKDAEKAKEKLHGHGYDNLILQVNWAKPRD